MILDEIALSTRKRVEAQKKAVSSSRIEKAAKELEASKDFPFYQAMRKEGISFICEVKKASPSKGVIAQDFDYLQIARDYEAAGADGISVLTEPHYFLGSTAYLEEIHQEVKTPLLCKDFIIDSYQIYQAKVIGAECILLICALLDTGTLKGYLALAKSLGLAALVEAHTKEEVYSALASGARMIGINNRNLKTFETNLDNCLELRELIPRNVMYIAESGIQTREDVLRMEKAGVNGVLVGETLMRAENKGKKLRELRGL